MIPQFELADPNHLNQDWALLLKFDDPYFKGDEIYFFKIFDYLIIHSTGLSPDIRTKKKRTIADQIEIPMPAVCWIINTIEIKFFRPPSEGGLPAEQFHWCEVIEGEELCINRSFDPTGEGLPGYRLVNLNRFSHISKTSKQQFSFFDMFLFEHGLMDFLKEIAGKYERGELG